jgi:hypothetical protein
MSSVWESYTCTGRTNGLFSVLAFATESLIGSTGFSIICLWITLTPTVLFSSHALLIRIAATCKNQHNKQYYKLHSSCLRDVFMKKKDSQGVLFGCFCYEVFPTLGCVQAANAKLSSFAFMDFASFTEIAYRAVHSVTRGPVETVSGPS